jgi:hypothetical protein
MHGQDGCLHVYSRYLRALLYLTNGLAHNPIQHAFVFAGKGFPSCRPLSRLLAPAADRVAGCLWLAQTGRKVTVTCVSAVVAESLAVFVGVLSSHILAVHPRRESGSR